jgi:hypothetical protein
VISILELRLKKGKGATICCDYLDYFLNLVTDNSHVALIVILINQDFKVFMFEFDFSMRILKLSVSIIY